MYQALRLLLATLIRQFFRRIRISGKVPSETGPLLILPNHPNFALDALVIATVLPRELWFLAKATLFKSPFLGRIFRALHMVPVYRRQDDPTQLSKNSETFRVAVDTLLKGEALVMFPEGVSMGERKLSPLKTGAARIAFLAEEAAGFTGHVRIQPVGLTYRSLVSFQSDVTITFAEPIQVLQYKELYQRDAVEAVNQLTNQIEEALRAVTVDLSSIEHTALVEKITELFHSAYPDRNDQELMKKIAHNVECLVPRLPDKKQALEARIDAFLSLLSLFSLSSSDLSAARRDWCFVTLVTPFVLLGALLYWVPYRLVGIIVPRLVAHPVQEASYKLGVGLFVFLLWLLLLLYTVAHFTSGLLSIVVVLPSLVLLGVVSNRYLPAVRLTLISCLWPGARKPTEILTLLRDQLISELEDLRVE